MSVWSSYPDLSAADLRTLVAVTAQILLESEEGQRDFPPDLLQQSPGKIAKAIAPLLSEAGGGSKEDVQAVLEDEELATRACIAVLDQVRGHAVLADRVATAFEARKQKMTGVELALLAGALLMLAAKIKRIRWSQSEKVIEFGESAEVVKAVTTTLAGSLGPR